MPLADQAPCLPETPAAVRVHVCACVHACGWFSLQPTVFLQLLSQTLCRLVSLSFHQYVFIDLQVKLGKPSIMGLIPDSLFSGLQGRKLGALNVTVFLSVPLGERTLHSSGFGQNLTSAISSLFPNPQTQL